ncbi:MAG: hypothetical protein BWY30_01187 [Tenericutes bacterium ADurb.Bin239]|nr:MAG: hypothetical protein BWY30_01187 [Tenericutes bacterium ADurb.Bin239]
MWGSTRQAQYGSATAETYVGSGYVGIKKVQLCAGDVALPFMPKSKTVEEDDCVHFYRIGQLLGIANTTSILAIANDFATKPLRTGVTTSNFKIYTTKANAIAEVAQQALTTPGVGDTNITQSSYIVNEVNGVIGLQLSGTPLTPGRAYSGYYVINQEL